MKKIINNIAIISICILLISANIIVGTPFIENTRIITITAISIFVVYMIVYKIMLKNKYIDIIKKINMLDICVIILCLCPWIPIILKTAVNVEESTNIAIRYLTVLILYITSKILFNQEKKYIKYITNTTIFLGIFSTFLGIENLVHEKISLLLYELGVPLMINSGKRMFGNIGYANTFALSVFVPLILSTHKFVKKGNYFYTAINFLFISGILLSYSKAMYMLLILWIVVYSILLKEKHDITKFLIHVGVTGILAIVYSKVFNHYFQREMALQIWLALIIFMVLAVAINKILNNIIEKREVKLKVSIACFIITVVLIIGIGLIIKVPLIIFETTTKWDYVEYIISEIEPNTEYKFEFEIESESLYNDEIYMIQIQEESNQLAVIEQHNIKVGTYSGKKYIEVKTDAKTDQVRVIFRSKGIEQQKGLKIKSFKINGEEYILNYLYLPNRIINLLRNFSGKSLSVTDRATFYKDAFKLIQRNPWTGIGGKGWIYTYQEVRSFTYFTMEVHSYPIQIYLEFGIGAIIAYVVMIGLVLEQFLKSSKDMIPVYLSLGLIVLHSVIDFDLSYMNILIYTFLLFSMVSSDFAQNTGKIEEKNK